LKAQPPGSRRKIFIVEDHPVFREGLVQIISGEKDLSVCGEAGDAKHAFQAIARLKPDLVLVEYYVAGKNGLELIKELRSRNRKVRILVVSMPTRRFTSTEYCGPRGDGYIMNRWIRKRSSTPFAMCWAGIFYVSERSFGQHGESFTETYSELETRPLDQLTDLELNILELLGRGKTAGKLPVNSISMFERSLLIARR